MAICMISAIIIMSCKKVNDIWGSQKVTQEQLDGIQSWIHTIRNGSTLQHKAMLDTLTKFSDFSNAIVKSIDLEQQLIIVPISDKFTTNVLSTLNSKKFLVFKEKNKIVSSVNILEAIPSDNSGQIDVNILPKVYRNNNAAFDGTISMSTVFLRYVAEYEYKSGKLEGIRYVLPNAGNAIRVIKNDDIRKLDQRQCIDWYWYYYVDGILVSASYAFTTCSGSDCEQTRIIDGQNSLQIKSNCSGGGGGSSGDLLLVRDVKNYLSNPCFSQVFDSMLANGWNTAVNGLLKQAFGLTNSYNVIIDDVPDIAPPVNSPPGAVVTGNTDPPTTDNQGNTNIVLHLNRAALANASKEMIAVTIMHEIIHGYLFSQGMDDLTQHPTMYSQYVSSIQSSLQSLFPSSTVNFSELAPAGLGPDNSTIQNNLFNGAGTRCQ